MDDNAILDLYFARDERAINETDRKYGDYCFSIADRILCNYSDSEETVSDTYWKTWNAIPPNRPNYLKLFLARITRNLAFTRWRKLTAAKRMSGETEFVLDELAECIPGKEQIDDQMNAKELERLIRKFLNTLPTRDQAIFLQRYFYVEDVDSIAMYHGMKRSNVHVILSRSRAKLKTYLMEEGYFL